MSDTIQLPARISAVLERDRQLHGCVMLTLAAFEPWLKSSGTPFFPEYTDHGPQHVQDTLVAAEGLIADGAYKILTPADVAALAISVLLHDSAMHLDEDGFIVLVTKDMGTTVSACFHDRPWSVAWREFLGGASRFDARKLIELFGNADPIRRPPLDPSRMTRRDRLLVGEFLRKHHHRLAHEIALWGIPSYTAERLCLVNVPPDLSDTAGILARSHGLPLRRCVDVLRDRDHQREYKGTHPTFLMTVLRIADYLQIQAERAPGALLRVKRLQSPFSQKEWKAHAAIVDIRHTHDDPEALFIEVRPATVETYLRVQEWLNNIQQELDVSWAMLGEVYGRYGALSNLTFVLRRVRSNLDNRIEFTKSVKYVPCRATFLAANPDLLKLLVAPLYGNTVEIAFRELVQNAVDAVRERRALLSPNPATTKPRNKRPDVEVSIEKKADAEWWVSVQDHGIGMTLETVLQYFLKVGASFRRSDTWRAHFEDDTGRVRVLRSGRFGVGVLASFMLGEEIHVSTRHIDATPNQGLSFVTSLDEEYIEIRRNSSLPVGTTIRIRVAKSLSKTMEEWFVEKKSRWGYVTSSGTNQAKDGYCLLDPKVERVVQPGDKKLKQPFVLPSPGDSPPTWRVIQHRDYEEIHWSYSKGVPHLACNGIVVAKGPRYGSDEWDIWWKEWANEAFDPPNVSVFDTDGNLPLVLQRTGVTRTVCPFSEVLLNDVIKDFIAFLLVHGPTAFSLAALNPASRKYRIYSGLKGTSSMPPWFLTEFGFGPMLFQNFVGAGITRLFLLANQSFGEAEQVALPLREHDAVTSMSTGSRSSIAYLDRWLRFVFVDDISYCNYLEKQLARLRITERTAVLRQEVFERYDRLKRKPLPVSVHRKLSRPWNSGVWGILSESAAFDHDPTLLAWIDARRGSASHYGREALALWNLAREQDRPQATELDRVWNEVVGTPLIPFDHGTRKKELAHAFDALAPYVERQEMLAAKKSKKTT